MKEYVDKSDRQSVGKLTDADIQVSLGAPGSGDDLVKRFKKENEEMPRDRQHEAAVLCCMAAAARLQALEVKRMENKILNIEDEYEYTQLRKWWADLGPSKQATLAGKIFELSRMVLMVTRYL